MIMPRFRSRTPERRRVAAHAIASRSAFSLVEMLVAVAALSLIAIGLARVFAATGDTLRIGRRVSRLNEYAAMIERQFRQDFASMSREGFLVIRHRLADEGAAISSTSLSDENARPRRVDELVFFQEGSFSSIRGAVNPARQATGSAARIYIGHGLRLDQSSADYQNAPRIDRPRAAAATDPTAAPSFGEPGPNQFAGDWILLRHVTVLAGPEGTARKSPLASGNDTFPDSAIQVGWQPAVSSLFIWESETWPDTMPGAGTLVRGGPAVRPLFASGLVDVATTDLTEIRARINDAWPVRQSGISDLDAALTQDQAEDQAITGSGDGIVYRPSVPTGDHNAPQYQRSIRRMQAWMAEALPANSDAGADQGQERRMRCELNPPDYLGSIGASGSQGIAFGDAESWRRTDQVMLTSSNFVPGCSDFIVEWSFGQVITHDMDANERGKLIWHGLKRDNADGSDVQPYLNPDITDNDVLDAHRRLLAIPSVSGAVAPLLYRVPHDLIQYTPAGMDRDTTLYSCFGYVDPFWPYHNAAGALATSAQDRATLMALYGQTIPWAWPKLIRITMTLADPNDPNIEQTYQFVFEVPERQGRLVN